jgi:hypothetical protein
MAAGQEQRADIEGRLGAKVDVFIEQRGTSPRGATTPPSPSGAASYSTKIFNLYLAVNVRRFAFSGTSGSQRSVPASSTRPGSTTPGALSNVVTLLVIRGISPSPPSGH